MFLPQARVFEKIADPRVGSIAIDFQQVPCNPGTNMYLNLLDNRGPGAWARFGVEVRIRSPPSPAGLSPANDFRPHWQSSRAACRETAFRHQTHLVSCTLQSAQKGPSCPRSQATHRSYTLYPTRNSHAYSPPASNLRLLPSVLKP